MNFHTAAAASLMTQHWPLVHFCTVCMCVFICVYEHLCCFLHLCRACGRMSLSLFGHLYLYTVVLSFWLDCALIMLFISYLLFTHALTCFHSTCTALLWLNTSMPRGLPATTSIICFASYYAFIGKQILLFLVEVRSRYLIITWNLNIATA